MQCDAIEVAGRALDCSCVVVIYGHAKSPIDFGQVCQFIQIQS
jgi:hypothetical protein